jgi:hypothetical protein
MSQRQPMVATKTLHDVDIDASQPLVSRRQHLVDTASCLLVSHGDGLVRRKSMPQSHTNPLLRPTRRLTAPHMFSLLHLTRFETLVTFLFRLIRA